MDFNALPIPDLISVFNDQITEFLSQLQVIIDDLTERDLMSRRSKANLEFYKNMVEKAISVNQEILIETFGSYILTEPDLVNRVVERDEQFFINYDYSGTTDDANIQELIMIVKDVSQHIGDDNKDTVFEYLQILCQLTVAYAQKKYN
jgi:maltodextrin utilization protein YvdJ